MRVKLFYILSTAFFILGVSDLSAQASKEVTVINDTAKSWAISFSQKGNQCMYGLGSKPLSPGGHVTIDIYDESSVIKLTNKEKQQLTIQSSGKAEYRISDLLIPDRAYWWGELAYCGL